MTPQKQAQPSVIAHKQKQVPQHLRSKLNKMISNLKSNSKLNSNGKVQWIDTNTIKILQDPIIIAYIGTQFDMSFKTFIKFLEMVGCKVKRVEGERMLGGGTGVYFIQFPVDNAQNAENNVLKQLMQPQPQQPIKTQPPNYYQLSIEAHLNRPQSQLHNVDYENELKDIFMKNFKNNVNQTNEFIYNAVYKILVSKGKQQLSPCEIMEILTEIRDRVFQNQKEVQECIQSFREKVRSFGESGGERAGQDKGDGKMIDQEEGRNGFQSVNFGSKNNLSN